MVHHIFASKIGGRKKKKKKKKGARQTSKGAEGGSAVHLSGASEGWSRSHDITSSGGAKLTLAGTSDQRRSTLRGILLSVPVGTKGTRRKWRCGQDPEETGDART